MDGSNTRLIVVIIALSTYERYDYTSYHTVILYLCNLRK